MSEPPGIAEAEGLDHELLVRFALIVIAYSNIEAQIAEFLSHLLEANHQSMYVLNQTVAASTQLKWVRTLVEERAEHQEDRDRLTELFNRIQTLGEDRNALVHGLWGSSPEPKTVLVQTIRLDRKEHLRDELVTRSDLNDLLVEAKGIMAELNEVSGQLWRAGPIPSAP